MLKNFLAQARGGVSPKSACALEGVAAVADEVVSHVPCTRVLVGRRGVTRGLNGGLGDRRLVEVGAFGNPFHRVPVSIARRTCHGGVRPGGIFAQRGFGHTRRLDEPHPVDAGDEAQTGDGVRHHQLREGQLLHRALRRVFHRHHVFGDPLLEPEQRSEVGSPAANLLEEARQERRRQVGSAVHERRQPARDVAR